MMFWNVKEDETISDSIREQLKDVRAQKRLLVLSPVSAAVTLGLYVLFADHSTLDVMMGIGIFLICSIAATWARRKVTKDEVRLLQEQREWSLYDDAT